MPSPPDSDADNRILIAAGTARYDAVADADLPLVPKELERIESSFAPLGYKRRQAASSLDPQSNQLRAMFAEVRKRSKPGDFVIAYYTGHGYRDGERFYLLARNSSLSEPDQTAVPAEDLARDLIKGSKASQTLIVLDACYAGAGAAEFMQIAGILTKIASDGPLVFVLAAARPKQEADQGAFSSALADALASGGRLAGRVQEFLNTDDLIQSVNDYLGKTHPAQKATLSISAQSERCKLFPNPLYRREIPAGIDLDAQHAFAHHWLPKARGAELGAGGWYFTGRETALQELAQWLSQERSDGRVHVVTGGAGCGKSAVIARLVTLANPTYRTEVLDPRRSARIDPATLPPENVISVAVHARKKLLAAIAAEIAAALDLAEQDLAELLTAIAGRPEKTVIVIDALDETDDKDEIVSRLLLPLAELPHVFLLIGARPDSAGSGRRVRAFGDYTVEIDLDDSRYIGVHDVACYVERRLLAAEEPDRLTPYRNAPEIAKQVAQAVAWRANNVFLVAHTTAHALLSRESIVDPKQPEWEKQLPTGIDQAFAQFFDELDARRLAGRDPGQSAGPSSATVRAVLLPLAFAEGEGLPWVDLWGAIASALAGSEVSDADIMLVRKHAAAFIVEALEQDRSVYRLYHESLAEQLRGSVADKKEAQQRIVGVLRSRVPKLPGAEGPDWARAHPYVLLNLAEHALKADMLREFVTDVTFVAAADPLRTLQALSRSTDEMVRRVYICYSLVFGTILDQPADTRLSYLEMTARQQADNELAELWGRNGPRRRWTVPWARFLPVAMHRAISIRTVPRSIDLGVFERRSVIVSGEDDGTIRVWDLASGMQFGKPMRGQKDTVTSVAFGTLDGRAVVVSSARDGMIRVWDLASRAQRGEPLRGHKGVVTSIALGTLNRLPALVSGGEDGAVRVWDLASGAQHGDAMWGHEGAVTSVAFGTVDGQPVIASGADDSTVRLWDVALGRPREGPLRGHKGRVLSVAFGTLDGRPMLVSGGEDGTVRAWDPEGGMHHGNPLRGHEGNWVRSVALGVLESSAVIVSGGRDASVQVWDFASESRREPLRGHEDSVTCVALRMLDGRPVIASAGYDGKVRVWDLAASTRPAKPLRVRESMVATLAVGALDDRPVIVSGGEDGTVQVWDLASGTPRGEPLRGHRDRVRSVAFGTLDGRPLVVSGGRDATVRVWDPVLGVQRGEPLQGHRNTVYSLSLGAIEGQPVIVSGSKDRTIRVWDLASGTQRGEPLLGHEGSVRSVALGTLNGRPVIVSGGSDRTIRVWDLASGTPHGKPISLSHDAKVRSVALGALDDQPVIISGGADKMVRLWDLGSGTPRGAPLRGHDYWVVSVAWGMLDGHPVIVSAAYDETVRVWDASSGREISRVYLGSNLRAVAFAEPGRVVVAAQRGLLLAQFEKEIFRTPRSRK